MTHALALARIAEVLQVPAVSVDDGFLDLGGDSLAALELADVLSEALGREVDVAEVVDSRTFGELLAGPARRTGTPE